MYIACFSFLLIMYNCCAYCLPTIKLHCVSIVLGSRSFFCPVVCSLCLCTLQYLSELALLNGDPYLKYSPSVVAASSVCLARHTLQQQAWVSVLYVTVTIKSVACFI